MYYLETHTLTEEERLKYKSMGLYCYDLRLDDDCNEIATIEDYVHVNNVGSMITSEKIIYPKEYKLDLALDFMDYDDFVNSDENHPVTDVYEILDLMLQEKAKAHIAKCEQGTCPCCHQDTLEYGTAEFVDEYVSYPWTCSTCGHQGEEWYELNFTGHNIETIAGEISLDEKGDE